MFPEVLLESDSLDFSFSGIKTAVKRELDSYETIDDILRRKIAFEFEETVTNILTKKLERALDQTEARMMILAGGVSANSKLRSKLESRAQIRSVPFIAPKKILYSMDNAAMIGIRAYYQYVNSRG